MDDLVVGSTSGIIGALLTLVGVKTKVTKLEKEMAMIQATMVTKDNCIVRENSIHQRIEDMKTEHNHRFDSLERTLGNIQEDTREMRNNMSKRKGD